MKVLVAGGTGVIGRQLLPLLTEVGDEVIVLSRPGAGVSLPGERVVRAVRKVAPDAVGARTARHGRAP